MEREAPIHEDSEVDDELIDSSFNLSEYVANLLLNDAKRGRESTKLQRKEEFERVVIGDETFPEKEADEIKTTDEKDKTIKKINKKKRFFSRFAINSKLERRRSLGVVPTFNSTPNLQKIGQTKSGDDLFCRNSTSLPGFSKLTETTSQSSLSELESFDAKSLSLTDFESDMDNASYVCFSEFECESRPLYLKPQRKKYVQLDLENYSEVSRKEWNSYHLWLKQIVKTKLDDNEVYGGSPSIRMLIFLHFYRLEVPIVDITPDNIASESDWRKKSRFIYHNVASFIDVPLDSSYSPNWWCVGNPVPTENYGTLYVVHIRQTYSEERRISKVQERRELKQSIANALMIGEPISVFSSFDPKKAKERDLYIRWMLRWITSQQTAHQLRVSCCKMVASLLYPEEIIPGLGEKVWTSSAAYTILNFAIMGVIQIPEIADFETINLEYCLDRGAAGKVLLGNYKGKNVAVKVCSESNVAFKREEFFFEVSLMCILRHPAILPCIAANLDGNPNFILITPFQERGSLRKVLQNSEERLSWYQRVKFALDIAKGMEFFHKYHLVHRDLKSPNILVSEDFEIFITDFATSRFLNRFNLNKKESFVGTTEWMAPEMAIDGKDYDNKVDVYSFGILLYEILTREIPFSNMKTYEIIDFVSAGGRPELTEAQCPFRFLISLTNLCWHANPKKRPNFSQIVSKLTDYLKRVEKSNIDVDVTPTPIATHKKEVNNSIKGRPKLPQSPTVNQDSNNASSPMGFLSFSEQESILSFESSPRKGKLTKNFSSPRLLSVKSISQSSLLDRNEAESTLLDCSDLGSLSISQMISGEVTLGHSPRPFSSPINAMDDSRYF